MHTFRLFLVRLLLPWIPETRGFALKRCLYRWCGAVIGEQVRICSSVRIYGAGRLSIGGGTWLGQEVLIQCGGEVEIGRDVDIAPRVMLTTGSHEVDPVGAHSAGAGYNIRLVIGDGAWLGTGVIVVPGRAGADRVIGRKAVVAAGAVVICDIGDYELAAGVPAICKKRIIETPGTEAKDG
ncbi:MAG: acyltransferase [Lentisphaerae bacterium]|nr:acyltransferase [Lentisphaerota bacterium]